MEELASSWKRVSSTHDLKVRCASGLRRSRNKLHAAPDQSSATFAANVRCRISWSPTRRSMTRLTGRCSPSGTGGLLCHECTLSGVFSGNLRNLCRAGCC